MPNLSTAMNNTPIPGESLTSKNKPHDPMFTPPKISGELSEVLEYIFSDLIDPDMIGNVLTIFNSGTAVDSFTEMYLTSLVKAGYINVDQMLLCIEPTMFMIMAICKEEGIKPRLTRSKPPINKNKEYGKAMRKSAIQKMLGSTSNKVPKNLPDKETPTGGLMGLPAPKEEEMV